MKTNMGSIDRVTRAAIAGIIAVLFIMQIITGIFGIVLLAIAGILVLTSLFRFCPGYIPFGISTRDEKHKNRR